MQVLALLLDVVIGIVLAGAIAPLALAVLPAPARGSSVLLVIAVACIVVVSLFRRLVVRPSERSDGR
jgi:uncharacterized membrane protein YfcA